MSGGSDDASWGREVFDRLYARDADPWGFETSEYERSKYARTLDLVGVGRFETALEIGCSIGVFTAALAQRCDALVAVDCAEAALQIARTRLAAEAHVRFERRMLPTEFPPGRFDLIVISEVLYFLCPDDIGRLADMVRAALQPGGVVILANWTGPTDTPCSGEQAARLFVAGFGECDHQERAEAGYRLDRISRGASSARSSVA